METNFGFTVNGTRRGVSVDSGRLLLDVLREDFHLTGTKYGCGEGQCGACSVLLDGKRVFSCQVPATAAADKTLVTIEGLAKGDALHPVQEAFLAESAFQCGYCTPGMIMSATALLRSNPRPSDAEIRQWMNRNVCRCGGYERIFQAVRRAAELSGKVTP